MSVRTRALAWSLALLAQFVFSAPIVAQDTQPAGAAAKDDSGVEVITVTARRKEENIQDIPIAVSAFSADDLGASNIEDVADVQFNVPNLSYSKTNFSGAGNISIRGVGNLATAATSESGTGIHVNDAPFPGSRIFETEFYDIESIQVLRGPQGTLFGRSSPGGAVNVYTKKPVLEEWGGYLAGEYGDFNHAKVRGALNVPMGEHFAARFAGYYYRRDGITKDINSGTDIDGRDVYAVRASLLGEWDDASFNLMAQYFRADDDRARISNQACVPDPTDWPNGVGCLGGSNKLRQGGINYNSTLAYSSGIISDTFAALAGTPRFLSGPQALFAPYLLGIAPAIDNYFFSNPCTVAGGCPGYVLDDATAASVFGANPNTWGLPLEYFNGTNRPSNLRTVNTQLVPRYVADEFQITMTANFDLTEQLTLTSVTGWHKAFVRSFTDYWWSTPDVNFDGGSRTFGFPDSPFANRSLDSEFVFDRSESTDTQFTQEVRVVSAFDGRFNFQVGAIYNDGEVSGIYDVYAASLEAFWDIPGDPVGLCGGAGVVGAGSCFDLAPETSYFRSETKPTKTQSYALFGESYVDLAEKTRFTLGVRYTDDKKTDRQRVNLWTCDPAGANPATGKVCGRGPFNQLSGGWTEVIWKASIDQHFDLPWAPESLAYFTFSTGYKGGGFNPPVDPNQSGGTAGLVPQQFKPETILAYELGYKGTWFDQLQLGVSAFYYDYSDMQISKIVNRTAVNENLDTKNYGVELETVWQATEALRIDFNVSWIQTDIQGGLSIDGADPTQGRAGWIPIKQLLPFPAGQNAVCDPSINPYCIDPIGVRGTAFGGLAATINNPGGECLTARIRPSDPGTGPLLADLIAANPNLCGYVGDGFAANLKGNELPGTPNWTLKLGAQYALPAFRGWVATPRVDFYWQSEMFGRVYNTQKDLIPSWEQLDANMTIAKEGSGWMFELWAKNLQDNNDVTGHYFTDPTSANFTNLFLLEPRTFGATVRYTWGESEY